MINPLESGDTSQCHQCPSCTVGWFVFWWTYWHLNKMAVILQKHFQKFFLNLISKLTGLHWCSKGRPSHKWILIGYWHEVLVRVDCYTALAWWQYYRDCHWDMGHGPRRHALWLVGLNINWDCLVPHCIMGSRDQREFPPFFRPQWQSLCTALTAGKCLP